MGTNNTNSMSAHTPGCPVPGPFRASGFTVQAIDHGRWYGIASVRGARLTCVAQREIAEHIARCLTAYEWDEKEGALAMAGTADLRAQRDELLAIAHEWLACTMLDENGDPCSSDEYWPDGAQRTRAAIQRAEKG